MNTRRTGKASICGSAPTDALDTPQKQEKLRLTYLNRPLAKLPNLDARTVAVLVLIHSGVRTLEMLSEELQDQYSKTTIQSFVFDLVDYGLVAYTRSLNPKTGGFTRIHQITQKGLKTLKAHQDFMGALTSNEDSKTARMQTVHAY